MEIKEAKQLVKKIKMASYTDAVAIMKELERKNGVPPSWWFPDMKVESKRV